MEASARSEESQEAGESYYTRTRPQRRKPKTRKKTPRRPAELPKHWERSIDLADDLSTTDWPNIRTEATCWWEQH